MGPEGLEPSPAWVRTRDPAANTSVPLVVQLAWKESNLRLAPYKNAALTTELHASSRAGGIRTHTHLIKSQGCYRYTTTLWLVGRICLHRRIIDIFLLLLIRDLVSSGSPGNRTQRHPVISRVRAASPRLPI